MFYLKTKVVKKWALGWLRIDKYKIFSDYKDVLN